MNISLVTTWHKDGTDCEAQDALQVFQRRAARIRKCLIQGISAEKKICI